MENESILYICMIIGFTMIMLYGMTMLFTYFFDMEVKEYVEKHRNPISKFVKHLVGADELLLAFGLMVTGGAGAMLVGAGDALWAYAGAVYVIMFIISIIMTILWFAGLLIMALVLACE